MTSGRRTVPDSWAQRGVITQYHLGERLGRFVTTLMVATTAPSTRTPRSTAFMLCRLRTRSPDEIRSVTARAISTTTKPLRRRVPGPAMARLPAATRLSGSTA